MSTLKRSSTQTTAYKLSEIESLNTSLRERIEQAMSEYQSNLIISHSRSNPSKIYKHIRSITNSLDTPSTIHLDSFSASSNRDIATIFNQYFHSVYTPHTASLPSYCDSLQSISISDIDVFEAPRL